MRKTLVWMLVCAALGVSCTTNEVGKKPIPARESDLVGVWIGLSEDSLYYFRLDLRSGGSGMCGYAYLREEPVLLKVVGWSTEANRIDMPITPVSKDLNQLEKMSGSAHSTVLRLNVTGEGWQTRVVLKREEDIEHRAKRVKALMTQHN